MTGITVIIPTYNRASFLERALQSVRQQTLTCSEIIVIDDGSTDDTAARVEKFASRCSFPVRSLHQTNKGPAAARNRGIQAAGFSYLAFLDSDDHWHKNKLKLQYSALTNRPEIYISHTRERWLRRGVHLNQKKIHQPGDGDIFSHCLQLCAVGMSTVMVKKELFSRIGLFKEDMPCCEDYDLWLRTSSRYPFLLLETPLTVKEGGRTDQVSWQFRMGMDTFRIAAILDLLRGNDLTPIQLHASLQELQKKCRIYGQGCVKHLRPEEGGYYLDIADWAKTQLDGNMMNPLPIPENPLLPFRQHATGI